MRVPKTRRITHGNHPRSKSLARIFQCLAVPQQPLKLLETLEIRVLKRLASAVQLRPWPPHFKGFSSLSAKLLSPLSVRCYLARSGSVPGCEDGEGLNLE